MDVLKINDGIGITGDDCSSVPFCFRRWMIILFCRSGDADPEDPVPHAGGQFAPYVHGTDCHTHPERRQLLQQIYS